MKTVLVLSFTNLAIDPRVNRQIRFLMGSYYVVAAGTQDPKIPNVPFISLLGRNRSWLSKLSALQLPLRLYERFYWRQPQISDALRKLTAVKPDVIIANDIEALPLSLNIAGGARVIFDAHEYAPLEREEQWTFRAILKGYRTFLCKKYIPSVHGMMTVAPTIAARYAQEHGVTPVVVMNSPEYENLIPHSLDPERIRLVHHGGAFRARRIENMIEVMKHLGPRFELSLVLTYLDKSYLNLLMRRANKDSRIHFLPAVPMRDISKYLNQFDIGIYILEPTGYNNRFALPNKFFEFIQARLAIAIGPSPEMAKIVTDHDLGVLSEEFTPQSLARKLEKLDVERITYYKSQSHKAAKELSSERSRDALLRLVEKVLGN